MSLLLPLPLLLLRLGEKHSVQRSSSMLLLLPAGVSAGGCLLLLLLLCSSGMTVLVSQGRMATCAQHRVADVRQQQRGDGGWGGKVQMGCAGMCLIGVC